MMNCVVVHRGADAAPDSLIKLCMEGPAHITFVIVKDAPAINLALANLAQEGAQSDGNKIVTSVGRTMYAIRHTGFVMGVSLKSSKMCSDGSVLSLVRVNLKGRCEPQGWLEIVCVNFPTDAISLSDAARVTLYHWLVDFDVNLMCGVWGKQGSDLRNLLETCSVGSKSRRAGT